jgi:hypothetical protein
VWWGVALIAAIVALIVSTALLKARPTRCPLCHRINVFHRSRIAPWQDERDEEGDICRRSVESVCGRCRSRYWMVWEDFTGTTATASLPPRPRG